MMGLLSGKLLADVNITTQLLHVSPDHAFGFERDSWHQTAGMPMGTKCAECIADLLLLDM